MLESAVGTTGNVFQSCSSVGVTPGGRVAVAVSVGSTIAVALRVGEEITSGSLFCDRLEDGRLVADGSGFAAGADVASAAQAANKMDNKKVVIRFICLSISMKN
jgi:hypothetical protein